MYIASHKSNPSFVSQGYVDLYSTLPWVMWEVVTSVEGFPDESYNDTRWLTGLWSTQAKVEGIMLKAAWHWGCDSSVINDPLGEPVHTPLYVGLLFAWGSVDSDRMFSLFSLEGSLTGNSDGYK
jgi:hypothetical protein